MLKIKIPIILLMFLAGLYIILPTFGINLPFIQNKLSLGFDLKGGSSLLLKVDLDYALKEKENFLLDSIKAILHDKKITFSKIYSSNHKVFLHVNKDDISMVQTILAESIPGTSINSNTSSFIEVEYTQGQIHEMNKKIVSNTINNLRRRIDEVGTKEAIIYSRGIDGIVIEMPGIYDPKSLKNIIGKTAKLTFHTMAEKGSLNTMIVSDKKGNKFYLNKKVELGGDLFKSVSLHMGRMGKPSIAVQFNSLGTKKFAEVTKQNVNKKLAIVLDNVMLTNPVINEHISNGQAEISGNFSVEEAKELIVLLHSGSLPTPLTIVEEHLVGPSLGAESVNQSMIAGFYAFLLVILLMFTVYGTFGLFAAISLVFNMVLIFSVIILCKITLTLPGIAGLILTIGMAVDTNILIFERIKDEYKNKQNLYNVIEKGFKHAKSTIIDSNLTTLIASGIMFCFGNSSIRGFTITVSIGILSSLISGIFVTHNIIKLWFQIKKPQKIVMGFLNNAS